MALSSTTTTTLSIILLSLLFLCCFSHAQKPKAFTFPIRKDGKTNQYYTNIAMGSNSTTLNVVIDIGAKFLYFNSADYFSAATSSHPTSYRPILCSTRECGIAHGVGCVFCFDSAPFPGCDNNTCADYALNPFTGTQFYSGLGQDVLRVYSTRGVQYKINNFPFQYSQPTIREGLARRAAGLISLGRTKISLQAQLSLTFKIRQKFALCLPSTRKRGKMIIGQGVYKSPFQGISKSLMTTPLIRNPVSTFGNDLLGNLSVGYFIDVKSIRVGTKTLSFNNSLLSINKNTGDGGTFLCTVRPYTRLYRPIYTALVDEFVKAAASKNIARVASVAPFGACFNAKTIGIGKTGPEVPIIDMVMHNKIDYWRFYGSNSMVRVSNDVICLAFVEEELNLYGPTTSIIVGGHQMEDYLLEFDVESSRLGFSRSLMLHDTSCSKFGAN